jgi:hypothetical protein
MTSLQDEGNPVTVSNTALDADAVRVVGFFV